MAGRAGKTRSIRNQTVFSAVIFLMLAAAFIYNQFLSGPNPTQMPGSASGSSLSVRMIDAGQGDALLLQCGGENLLIDAGTNAGAETLVTYLRELYITKLDIVVGTHPHEDHIGGLDAVIDSFDIGMIVMPKVLHETKTFEDVLDSIEKKNLTVTSPKPGDTFELGDAVITILAPQNETYADMNNYSVAVRVTLGEASVLLTGDAEEFSEKEMLSSGLELKSDILKIGHHGSSTSSSEAFLDAVSPRYALISCGAGNTYGHPHRETIEKLEKKNIKICRTDTSGTVILTIGGNGEIREETGK